MGARTEERHFYSSEVKKKQERKKLTWIWFDLFILKVRAPSPTHYQDVNSPEVKPSLKPFGMSSNRFKKEHKEVMPG